MKIKVKVKNIILFSLTTLFIILIIVPFATIEIGKILDIKGNEKASVFYENYLSMIVKPNEDEAAYKYAELLTSTPDKYQIMMQSSGGDGGHTTVEEMEKAKEIIIKVLNRTPKDSNDRKYYNLSYIKLMDLYISTQRVDELLSWIQWGQENNDSEVRYISSLYYAFYSYANRDYDQANLVLNENIDQEQIDNRYYFIIGEIALFKGEYDLAKEYFEKAQEMGWNYTETLFGSRSYVEREYWYKNYEASLKGDYRIRGKITFNDEPMPFVEVYCKDYLDNGIRSGGGDHLAITDINGEYETIGLRPGRYNIGIGISNSVLYDKVYLAKNTRFIDLNSDMNFDFDFTSPINILNPKSGSILKDNIFTVQWEEVEGADYYDVQTISFQDPVKMSGSSSRFSILDDNKFGKLKETKMVFDIGELNKRTGSISWSGEDRLVSPSSVLGVFKPGFEYPIVVNAFDSHNNLIGSSLTVNTYYDNMSSVKLEGELTVGESLILNMKYEEAINHYNETLTSDSNNKEALVYLTKIYMVGWKMDEGDYDKAMEYAIRYNNSYGDSSLMYDVIRFMDKDALRKHKDKINELLVNQPDNYLISKYNLSLRDYEAAREAYEKLEYKHLYLLYIDLYFGQFHKALSRLEQDDFDLYRMNKNILENSIKNLRPENIGSDDYQTLRVVIDKILSEDLSNEEGKDLFNSIYNNISNQSIKKILNEIKNERHWDQEY